MRFAYADPPYIGQAKKHYDCAEIDHKELIKAMTENYDGWALSCSTPSLREILPLCPEKIRICSWVKPFCIYKPNVGLAYSWEPIILYNTRKITREQKTVKDFCTCNITLKKGLVGVKPEGFCFWLFQAANLTPQDEFIDLFIGSGAVTKAWEKWKQTCLI